MIFANFQQSIFSRKMFAHFLFFTCLCLFLLTLNSKQAAAQTICTPGIGGQIFSEGYKVEVEILPSDAGYTSEIYLYSPESRLIGTNRNTGAIVQLGNYNASAEMIFGIHVLDTGDIFRTGPGSRNADGLAHANVQCGANGIITIGFEDIYGGGDSDFNDVQILVKLTCAVSNLTPITDTVAQQFEAQNGNVVDVQNLNPTMRTAQINFLNAVANAGGNFYLNSAYRPPAYQLHLREVWDKWQLLKSGNNSVCQSVRTQVQTEFTRHNPITRPAGACGFHTQGLAIDVAVLPSQTGLPLQTLLNLATQAGLYRRMPVIDRVHFELFPPRQPSCPSQLNGVEENVGGIKHSLSNEALSPTIGIMPSAIVKVSKRAVNGQQVYSYRVFNNNSRRITSVNVGFNISGNTAQLVMPPLNWNPDTGLPAASATSPSNWTPNVVTTEESEYFNLEWRGNDFNASLPAKQITRGFSVTLPQSDDTYLNSFSTIIFEDGNQIVVPLIPDYTFSDFDFDNKSDLSVFRPSNGTWYLNRSAGGVDGVQFGLSTDRITPADFDGDGKTDIAVYRDGTWYWLRSSDGSFRTAQFGISSDIPVPADYTGDGKAELAVYRSGNWYFLNLQNNQFQVVQFGIATDKPVPADFDGDGVTDIAVYRNGFWYLLRSRDGFTALQWGLATDKLTVGDYDGDGKSDFGVFRPSNGVWYLLRSQAGFIGLQFGIGTDVPTPADYDGDGKTDISVFRDGVWYRLNSSNGQFQFEQFGIANDKPIPAAYVP